MNYQHFSFFSLYIRVNQNNTRQEYIFTNKIYFIISLFVLYEWGSVLLWVMKKLDFWGNFDGCYRLNDHEKVSPGIAINPTSRTLSNASC